MAETILDDPERLGNLLGHYAKLICSAVHLAGREPRAFIASDLVRPDEGIDFPWGAIDLALDPERRTVTLMAPSGLSRTARFHGDQGSTILPPGRDEVYFTPMAVPPRVPPAATTPWPMGDLLPATPLPAGVDEAALATALDGALDDDAWPNPPRTRGLVVCLGGRLVAERYAIGFGPETRQICWSAGKSITAALIGILVQQGTFAPDDPAPIAEWRGPDDLRAAITIRHLLNMSSGLRFARGEDEPAVRWTDRDDHMRIYTAPIDVFRHAIDRPLADPPNTIWRYRNCDPLSLGLIVRRTVEARGEEYLSFPQRALFDRIGIRRMVLEPDPWGNFIMTGFEYGVARDWARFALLHLWDGRWRPTGERILPEGWSRLVSTPVTATPDPIYAGLYTGGHYGGQFWLNAGGRWPNVPRDAYWAAGRDGQLAIVIPSRDVVIARMGHTVGPASATLDSYMDTIISRLLAALGPGEAAGAA